MPFKINTTRFGEIEVNQDAVISVPGGLIGFAEQEKYIIIEHDPKSPFFWLQAADLPDLAFVIVDPFIFKTDYEINLSPPVRGDLHIESPSDVTVYVIVTIPHGRPQDMTANMLGPLVLNNRTNEARQLIIDDDRYSHRHRILPRPQNRKARKST